MKFSAVFKFQEAGTGRDCVCYITKDYDRYAYANEWSSGLTMRRFRELSQRQKDLIEKIDAGEVA